LVRLAAAQLYPAAVTVINIRDFHPECDVENLQLKTPRLHEDLTTALRQPEKEVQ